MGCVESSHSDYAVREVRVGAAGGGTTKTVDDAERRPGEALAAFEARQLSMRPKNRADPSLTAAQHAAMAVEAMKKTVDALNNPNEIFHERKRQYREPKLKVNGVAQELIDDIHAGKCVLFLGAGWDAPAGMPSWVQLLHKIIDDGAPISPPQQADLKKVLRARVCVLVSCLCQLSLVRRIILTSSTH
jgi:hypothetical protein